MKAFQIIHAIGWGIACFATPASAQNLAESSDNSNAVSVRAQAIIPEESPLYALQNPRTLDSGNSNCANREPVADLNILRSTSQYAGVRRRWVVANSEDENLKLGLALLSATYREGAKPAASGSCSEISLSITQRISLDPATTLEIVESEVTANPGCACEIVKAAIQTAGDDSPLVTGIVESSITAAPEHMRLISQCAIAAAPESLAAIQALLAKLDPNGGDSPASAKNAKSGKNPSNFVVPVSISWHIKALANPLDLPPLHIIPPLPPILPPLVSNVNP